MEKLEKFDADDHPRGTNAKEILIRQKYHEFIFPFADGTSKLSGREYEFWESTRRREPTVRSEVFNRELPDEPGESTHRNHR